MSSTVLQCESCFRLLGRTKDDVRTDFMDGVRLRRGTSEMKICDDPAVVETDKEVQRYLGRLRASETDRVVPCIRCERNALLPPSSSSGP